MPNDEREERDSRECLDGSCGSPDCGRCQVVCDGCGGEHASCDGHDVDGERDWDPDEDRSPDSFDLSDVDGVRW